MTTGIGRIATLLLALNVGIGAAAHAEGDAVALRGAGSTFAAPLYKRWGDAFLKERPAAKVVYDSVGSGEGIARFTAGTVDFGASDRRLTENEIAKVATGAVQVPTTAGMVVVAYSLSGIAGELKLPRDVLVDIFAGRITNWSEPRLRQANPELKLPRRTIALIGRSDGSGTTHAFTSHLAAVSPTWNSAGPGVGILVAWPSTALLARGNEGVSHLIKISDGAIGYVEYGFAKRLGLSMAALQNKSGAFVAPSAASAQHGLSEAIGNPGLVADDPSGAAAYPIVTYSWMLLHGRYADATKGAALTGFVGWGLTGGQPLGVELGYVPLPPAVVEHGRAALASIR